MTLRRFVCILTAAVLCLSLLPAALAEEDAAPLLSGDVWDMAGVLSDSTAADLATLNERMSGCRLTVVTRHFLGGKDAGAYARELLDSADSEEGAVLLLVIGEEDYALALGEQIAKALPAESQQSLLAQNFRTPYLNRAYDEAVADFALAFAGQVSRARGEKIDLDGLFGRIGLSATPAPQQWSGQSDINAMWQDFFGEDSPENRNNRDQEADWEGGLGTLIFWAFVIYFLFFRRRKRRRYDFGHGPHRRW